MFELGGRVALVTGGGRGIGRGITLALARAGADVAIADIDLENAETTAKDAEALQRRCAVVRTDVTDPESVAAGIAEAVDRLGRLDVVVNNAGVIQGHIGAEITLEDFDRCYDVNLKGIWQVSRAAIPHLQARGGGRIINIASIAGRLGGGGLAPYSASKAAAISLTQSLASELGQYDITVNAICPGLLWTPMWRQIEGMIRRTEDGSVIDERAIFERFLQENCPLRREQTPEDIGSAVVFLASAEARNITGQALNVDGGIRMN